MGSLSFDKEGYLSDGVGGRLQGYVADTKGEVSSRLTDVRIQTNNIPPNATKDLQLNVQLSDARSELLDPDKPLGIQPTLKKHRTLIPRFQFLILRVLLISLPHIFVRPLQVMKVEGVGMVCNG